MAVITLENAFSTPRITRLVSRVKTPANRLQTWLGMGPGGPAVNPVGGHYVGWDIFDRTRTLAKGRAIGAGPAVSTPNPVGHVSATIYRSHEKMHLSDERLFLKRPQGQNWGNLDRQGQSYLASQTRHQAQRLRNAREFMCSRLLRGEFGLLSIGDDWLPVDISGSAGTEYTVKVDYKVPDTNKSKLNMIAGGDILATSWHDIAAPMIADCFQISAAMEQLHGRPLKHIWCDSVTIQYAMLNTGMIAAAGSANVVFSDWRESPEVNVEGIRDNGHMVIFRALPWLVWHVYDAGLDVPAVITGVPTFTKFFDSTHCAFLPEPDQDWVEMLEGSELVRETVVSQPTERYGIAAWAEPCTQPSGRELLTLDNAIPALYIPNCVAYGLTKY